MIPPMGKVSLPCYEGFTKFLVWPKPHAVSTYTCKQMLSTFLYFKVKSYYGLMAKESIPPQVHSGNNVVWCCHTTLVACMLHVKEKMATQ